MNWSWWISENDIFIPSNSSGPTYISIGYQTCIGLGNPLLNFIVVSAACSLRLVKLGMFALVYPSTFFCCLGTCVPIVLHQDFGSFFISTLFLKIWSKNLEMAFAIFFFFFNFEGLKGSSLHCYLWCKVKVKKCCWKIMLLSVNLNDNQVFLYSFQNNMAICLSIHFPSVYLPSYFDDVCVCVEQIHFNYYLLSPCI